VLGRSEGLERVAEHAEPRGAGEQRDGGGVDLEHRQLVGDRRQLAHREHVVGGHLLGPVAGLADDPHRVGAGGDLRRRQVVGDLDDRVAVRIGPDVYVVGEHQHWDTRSSGDLPSWVGALAAALECRP
jgi:hypothetical protein